MAKYINKVNVSEAMTFESVTGNGVHFSVAIFLLESPLPGICFVYFWV